MHRGKIDGVDTTRNGDAVADRVRTVASIVHGIAWSGHSAAFLGESNASSLLASVQRLVPLLLAARAATLTAQSKPASPTVPHGPVTAAVGADAKRAMTVADIGKWRTIRDVSLSDDGTWASYGYQQRRVDDTLFLENLATNTRQAIARASRAQFSDDPMGRVRRRRAGPRRPGRSGA